MLFRMPEDTMFRTPDDTMFCTPDVTVLCTPDDTIFCTPDALNTDIQEVKIQQIQQMHLAEMVQEEPLPHCLFLLHDFSSNATEVVVHSSISYTGNKNYIYCIIIGVVLDLERC